MLPLRLLLKELDEGWPLPSETKIRLQIIGSTALMLQTDYGRATKDSDVIETVELGVDVRDSIRRLAGPNSKLHQRHKIYVELVPSGLLFRRQLVVYEPLRMDLRHFDISAMSVLDVAVSKLAGFHASDREEPSWSR